MFPVYEEKKENLHLRMKVSRHASPHLHNSIEFIYVTEGTLELGMGQELFHMDAGDFAVIFPDVIVLQISVWMQDLKVCGHLTGFSGKNSKRLRESTEIFTGNNI